MLAKMIIIIKNINIKLNQKQNKDISFKVRAVI